MCLRGNIGLLKRVVNILHLLQYFKNINYLHTPQEWEDSLASGNVSCLTRMQMNLLLLMPPFMPSDGA